MTKPSFNSSIFSALILTVLLLGTTRALGGGNHYAPNDDRAVQLNTIQTLIFRKGAMTTGRRTSPVPQLTCTPTSGSSACGSGYEPSVIKCSNIGIDYNTGDPSWQCTAELENGLRLGTTDVICEGFRDRDDPWVLRGSCGLEYTLEGSPVRAKTGASQSSYRSDSSSYSPYKASYSSYSSSSWTSWIKWLVGFFILYMFLRSMAGGSAAEGNNPNINAASAGGGGGTGGGGRGGWFGGGGGGGGGGFFGRNNYYRGDDCNPAGAGGAGGAGFWQGLGAGAGLGYLFGRRNNNNYGAPGYGWGNGGWGNGGWGTQPRYGGGGYAAPAPQVFHTGPATQTATGYGGTRRRG